MRTVTRARTWRAAERILWIAALLALAGWVALRVKAHLDTQQALQRFAAARSASPVATTRAVVAKSPDFRLWSPHAMQAWKDAQSVRIVAPLAVLRVARLQLEAPILEGTSDATLDRGIGHIEDTPAPGAEGNSGLAGHRDSFFRVLKDITSGDTLELETVDGVATYTVDRTWIVGPEDVSVLDPTPASALTLVTCYPFYYVGSAPQRFIVRATRTSARVPERGE